MATILVVGASRGIGFEFVRQYAAEGNRVIATHRSAEAGAKLRELGAPKGSVLEFHRDDKKVVVPIHDN